MSMCLNCKEEAARVCEDYLDGGGHGDGVDTHNPDAEVRRVAGGIARTIADAIRALPTKDQGRSHGFHDVAEFYKEDPPTESTPEPDNDPGRPVLPHRSGGGQWVGPPREYPSPTESAPPVAYGHERQDYPGGPIYRVGTSIGAESATEINLPPGEYVLSGTQQNAASGKLCRGDGKPCPPAVTGKGPGASRCEQNGLCQRLDFDKLPKLKLENGNLSVEHPAQDTIINTLRAELAVEAKTSGIMMEEINALRDKLAAAVAACAAEHPEVAELRKDAERYRWLRLDKRLLHPMFVVRDLMNWREPEEIDSVIDAATGASHE